MILFLPHHISDNLERQKELEDTLQKNQQYFDIIQNIGTNDKRVTYEEIINIANNEYPEQICIIANSDIVFDSSIFLCNLLIEDNMIITLTRHESETGLSQEGCFINDDFYSYSQDVWIFKSRTLNNFDSKFSLGIPACENRFLFEALKSGIKIVNLSHDIITYHNHKSQIRTWVEKDRYKGPLAFPKITTISDDQYTDCLVQIKIKNKKERFVWKKSPSSTTNQLDINEFYECNTIKQCPVKFDENFYLNFYNLNNYYQPYCKNNNIPDKKRAYFHYMISGVYTNFYISQEDLIKKESIPKINAQFIKKIDKFLPPHKKYENIYTQKILKGREKAINSKIAVVSLARNCEKHLLKSITEINKIECEKLSMFIFENDSEDRTKNILELASKQYDNLAIKCINNNREHLSDRSVSRTVALAEYRNLCLDWVKDYCKDYDYTIVLDLDADLGFSVEGIYNSIGWMDNLDNVGGIASYSLFLKIKKNHFEFVHYDSFATRMSDWLESNTKDINNIWFRNWHPPVGSNPIHMYSCFGGLAIYKNEAFLSGRYSGELGSEHVQFHKDLYENGYKMYLNPSSRFFSVYDTDFL